MVALTATCLGELHQAQRGVISRYWLEGNIGVPLGAVLLLGAELIGCLPLVQLAMLDRADCGDLLVVTAQLTRVVEDGVDVESRCLWTTRQFSEAQYEFLLEVIREAVLGAEEDHPALGDYDLV